MRILAVRGCNLASLDGSFAVELDAEPLRRAGLFAITGPTGAGKSTLLDALCLALFDTMPRLPEGRGVLLGRDGEQNAIASTDVRSVMRRGAASCWAEVDFIGADGDAYRAHWKLRRARLKAGGPLQKQEMSLTSLDGATRFGDGKTSVLQEIERRLGLNFERFRRSVLLAQGDFANFLKAPAKDRSELLELLTGTEIYSRISRAAYERGVAEQRALEGLDAQRRAVDVLTVEDRTALDAEAVALAAAVEADGRAHEAARRAVQWHERDAQLARSGAEAEARATEAAQAWQDSEERRRQAAGLRRLQPLRGLLVEADRCAAEAGEAHGALALAGATVAARRQTVEEAEARHGDARRQFETACTEQGTVEPVLERAAELDSRIATLSAEHGAASADLVETVTRSTALAGEEQSLASGLDAVRRQEAELAAWLSAEAALTPLAEQWARWEAALLRYRDVGLSHRVEEAGCRRHGGDAERLEAELTRQRSAQAAAAAAQAEAASALAALQADAVPDLAEVSRRRAALSDRRDALSALERLAERLEQLRVERTAIEADQAGQRTLAEAEEAGAAATKADRTAREAALGEAEASLRRLHLAQRQDVESLRGQLTDGEPCPVCGGVEHPWATGGGPLAQLAGEQEQRVAAVRTEVEALLKAQAGHEATARGARTRMDVLGRQMEALRREADGFGRRWAEGAAALDLPADGAAAGMLAECRAAVETELAEVAAQETRALAHKARCDAAAKAVRDGDAAVVRVRDAVEAGQRAWEEARHAVALAMAARDRCARDMQDALAELSGPCAELSGWRDAVESDPEAFRIMTGRRVSAFLGKRQARAEAARHAEEMAGRIAAKATERDAARHAEQAVRRRVEGLAERLGQLRRDRSRLLEGRPVAEVKRTLAEARHRAEALVERATIARQEATMRLSAAEQEQATRGEAARRCADRATASTAALSAAAAERDTTVEEARRRLSQDEGWLEREETALAALETALRDAGLLVAERARLRAEHAGDGPPAEPPEEARIALAETGERLERGRGALATLRARLDADGRNRERLAASLAAFEEQKARHALWAAMSQLLGSANGHKLRNFAQSLSLDMLLRHANGYLDELARRYRLERVAGADLEIQVVDREMGDERRGVHSLSGGEMFLVSLALALGLSSMAAGQAGGGIGTLFIDEGFGTLDPDSLDVALSCLEALQASGRQVGVISHVPALMDRIGVRVCVTPRGGGRSAVEVVQAVVTASGNAFALETVSP